MRVKNGYTIPTIPPTDSDARKKYECNVEAKNVILSGLFNIESLKVKKRKSAKDIWDRLKKIYGEEPWTAKSDYGRKKKKGSIKCTDDKRRSVSS